MQLHPATDEAREAERLQRIAAEEAQQKFLIEQRKNRLQAVRKAEENYNFFELTIEKNKKQPLLFDPKAFPLRLTTKAMYLHEGDELVRACLRAGRALLSSASDEHSPTHVRTMQPYSAWLVELLMNQPFVPAELSMRRSVLSVCVRSCS